MSTVSPSRRLANGALSATTLRPSPVTRLTGLVSHERTDWETTRYLAVATQLNLRYARFVVSQIIGEPFRAVAPAAGADVVVVTRWALAALRRRAWRDATLTGLLIIGAVASIWGWTWIPIAVIAVLAIFVVAFEQWVCDVKSTCAPDAPRPVSRSPCSVFIKSAHRRQARNDSTTAKRKPSYLPWPFGLCGQWPESRSRSHRSERSTREEGQRREETRPIPFSTLQLHGALETALNNMEFPELRVGQQLHVNGEHVAADPRLLPEALGPPVADTPSDLLDEGCAHPTPEARTYVCAEISGWKGQLVVSLLPAPCKCMVPSR